MSPFFSSLEGPFKILPRLIVVFGLLLSLTGILSTIFDSTDRSGISGSFVTAGLEIEVSAAAGCDSNLLFFLRLLAQERLHCL